MAEATYPRLQQPVLDAIDARALAEFYRELLGLRYRPGDEAPPAGKPDRNGGDWLVLVDANGSRLLAFQHVDELERSTWPEPDVPQQLHIDLTVPDAGELERHKERAVQLGARLLRDRSDDPDEPLYVFADPEGHPFCIFVA